MIDFTEECIIVNLDNRHLVTINTKFWIKESIYYNKVLRLK